MIRLGVEIPVDHLASSRRNYLTGLEFDRASERRANGAWIRERLQLTSTRFVAVRRSQVLIRMGDSPAAAYLWKHQLPAEPSEERSVFLGRDAEGVSYFALGLSEEEFLGVEEEGGAAFQDFKLIGQRLEAQQAGLLAYSRAMIHWHETHRFCGRCGRPNRILHAGHLLQCEAVECGQQHFPRTDPAIIVLIERAGRCLLGRSPAWPSKVYSTIAGFVEPGESLEQAVSREVFEEVGVRLDSVEYRSSQPWPFPCSLMLGFRAHARTEQVRIDPQELEDARWWSRDGLRRAVARREVLLPHKISIARRLVEDWLEGA